MKRRIITRIQQGPSGPKGDAGDVAGTVTAEGLDFASSTDIGADLADADEILVSDGGGNTTRRKSAISRLWTYILAKITANAATTRTALGLGTAATTDATAYAAASHTHALGDLDIDGGTDIGADLADADLIVVDDGAGGTNRKSAISRLWTYILAKITANAATTRTALGLGDAATATMSYGGNGATDSGKLPRFGTSGQLVATSDNSVNPALTVGATVEDGFAIYGTATTNGIVFNGYASAASAAKLISLSNDAATIFSIGANNTCSIGASLAPAIRTALGLGTAATTSATAYAAASHTHALGDLDIDGGTDIGAGLADADLIIVDDGAGGTNRKSAISRLWTYIQSKAGSIITQNANNVSITGGSISGITDLAVADGGTGASTAAAARTNLGAAASTVVSDYIGGDALTETTWGSADSLDIYEGTTAGDPSVTLADDDYYSYAPVSSQDCVVYLPPTPSTGERIRPRIANSNATSPGAVDIYDSDEVTLVDSVDPGDDVVVSLYYDGADWVAEGQDAPSTYELRPSYADGTNHVVALAQNFTLKPPPDLPSGEAMWLQLIQNATPKTMTLSSGFAKIIGSGIAADVGNAAAGDVVWLTISNANGIISISIASSA